MIRRIGGAILVTIFVSFVAFVLLDMTPGDAADTLVGDFASADQLAAVRSELGLDLPWFDRYLGFMAGVVLHGDLGKSLISGRPVTTLIGERLPHTTLLALAALGLAVLLGGTGGLLAASRPGGYLDLGITSLATLGMSIPTFWAAVLLVLVFSLRLRWLPVAGAGTPEHFVLPVICLALPFVAVIARMVRASVLDVKHADYVRTARAKGLRSGQTWRRHILRNGLIPVITVLGLHAGNLLGGAIVIETIFAWPGLGRLTVQGILDNDFPTVLGAVLFIAVMYQVVNLAVDVMHALLDPRVGTAAL
ncbi:MAG: ABC transporter permease [Caldilineales bacterium]|nr:ABC transporter permease [Caldilineales bacterium]